MVYGCVMASETILYNLDTQLIEAHRRCLQGLDESFSNLGRNMLRRLMGIQPGNSRSNPAGWFLLHDFLNEELLGPDINAVMILLLGMLHPTRRIEMTVAWMNVADLLVYYDQNPAMQHLLLETLRRGQAWPVRNAVEESKNEKVELPPHEGWTHVLLVRCASIGQG